MNTQRTILVVEDNDFVRMQIVTFLGEAGYQTIEATDGNQALELIDNDLALAIVDVRMEPMDGFDFINHLQTQGIFLPVVLVTGDEDHDLLERAQKHGVSAVLLKPVQKDRLTSTVNRMIERGNR